MAVLFLALLPFFFPIGSLAADGTVSRFDLLDRTWQALHGRPLTEVEALGLGVLEPYSDGRFHLDWPVNRGLAARVFHRLQTEAATGVTLPHAFADVATGSPWLLPLNAVGGVFTPGEGNRFLPDLLLTPTELQSALRLFVPLLSGTPGEVVREQPLSHLSSSASGSSATALIPGSDSLSLWIRPNLGFPEADLGSGTGVSMSGDLRRLLRLHSLVPDHLAPTETFDLDKAEEGQTELEGILASFALTVQEITEAEIKPAQEAEVREALQTFANVLEDLAAKLDYSQTQLQSTLLVDPPRLERCAALRQRITAGLQKAEEVRRRVRNRLAKENRTQ